MTTKKFIIRLSPDGKIQAEVEGIKGKSCRDYIKILEEVLNAQTIDSEPTDEYYEPETNLEIEPLEKYKNELR